MYPKSVRHMFTDYRHLARLFYSGRDFVAFDTETTGLHAADSYLMEIGAVRFNCKGVCAEPFDALIRPPVPISEFLTQLTHIDNAMVAGKPRAAEVLPDFLRYLQGSDTVLVAHNAPFDLGFINAELERMTFPPLANLTVDTLPLARWAYPGLVRLKEKGQYKLQSLAKRFNVEVLAAHRAADDARVCMELFKRMLQDTMPVQKDCPPPGQLAAGQEPALF